MQKRYVNVRSEYNSKNSITHVISDKRDYMRCGVL